MDGGGGWRRTGGQDRETRSRVGWTPVNHGWEGGLGTMPGKECRGAEVPHSPPDLVCSAHCLPTPLLVSKTVAREGLPEVACDPRGTLCPSLCRVHTDRSPRSCCMRAGTSRVLNAGMDPGLRSPRNVGWTNGDGTASGRWRQMQMSEPPCGSGGLRLAGRGESGGRGWCWWVQPHQAELSQA